MENDLEDNNNGGIINKMVRKITFVKIKFVMS